MLPDLWADAFKLEPPRSILAKTGERRISRWNCNKELRFKGIMTIDYANILSQHPSHYAYLQWRVYQLWEGITNFCKMVMPDKVKKRGPTLGYYS
jgi:hypothetical protein